LHDRHAKHETPLQLEAAAKGTGPRDALVLDVCDPVAARGDLARASDARVDGLPDSYAIFYDEDRNTLGLQAARLNVTRNAYAVNPRGNHGGMRIFAHRLIREFNLYLTETVVFPRCFIDHTGTLILELNDVRPATRKRKKKYE